MKLLLDQRLTKTAQFHLAYLLRGKDNGFVQITNSFLQFEFLKVSKLEGLKVWCFFFLSNLIFLNHEHPFDSHSSLFMPSGFREDRGPLFLARAIEVVSNCVSVGWKLIWLFV